MKIKIEKVVRVDSTPQNTPETSLWMQICFRNFFSSFRPSYRRNRNEQFWVQKTEGLQRPLKIDVLELECRGLLPASSLLRYIYIYYNTIHVYFIYAYERATGRRRWTHEPPRCAVDGGRTANSVLLYRYILYGNTNGSGRDNKRRNG